MSNNYNFKKEMEDALQTMGNEVRKAHGLSYFAFHSNEEVFDKKGNKIPTDETAYALNIEGYVPYVNFNYENLEKLQNHILNPKGNYEYLKEKQETINALKEEAGNDVLGLKKLKAVENMFDEVDKRGIKSQSDFEVKNEKERKYLLEYIAAHELSHTLYSNKQHTMTEGVANISLKHSVKLNKNIDEMRADSIAIKLLQQKYGKNDEDLNSVIDKVSASRLIHSMKEISESRPAGYLMYELFKDNNKALNKLPVLNKDNLNEFETQIEKIAMKQLKDFGVQRGSFITEEDLTKEKETNVEMIKKLREQDKEDVDFFCNNKVENYKNAVQKSAIVEQMDAAMVYKSKENCLSRLYSEASLDGQEHLLKQIPVAVGVKSYTTVFDEEMVRAKQEEIAKKLNTKTVEEEQKELNSNIELEKNKELESKQSLNLQ